MRIQITMTLPNDAASVPLARRTVSAALKAAGVTPDSMDDVALALTEACANVVRHASESDDYDVVIDISDERLAVDVTDAGRGFAPRRRRVTPTMPAAFSEDGRGAALMRALTDMTVFDHVTGAGSSVHMVKHLQWTEDAPLGGQTTHRHQRSADGPPAHQPDDGDQARAWVADERSRRANQRHHIAAQRDHIADERDRIADERDAAAAERDQAAQERTRAAETRRKRGIVDPAADRRDAEADRRDREANRRDRDADLRDEQANQLEAAEEAILREVALFEAEEGIQLLVQRADRRDQRAEQRDRLARQRDTAAQERPGNTERARVDRAHAAGNREASAEDRDEAASDRADLRAAFKEHTRHPQPTGPSPPEYGTHTTTHGDAPSTAEATHHTQRSDD